MRPLSIAPSVVAVSSGLPESLPSGWVSHRDNVVAEIRLSAQGSLSAGIDTCASNWFMEPVRCYTGVVTKRTGSVCGLIS